MLKNLSKVLITCLLLFSVAIPAYANEKETTDQRLASLQEIMNKVNTKLGSTYYIPEENKEKIVEKLEGLSLKEVEEYLIEQYKVALQNGYLQQEMTDSSPDNSTEEYSHGIITPLSITEQIRQTSPIQYNCQMYQDATVFSATGAAGTFIYQSLGQYGIIKGSSTGFYFKVDQASRQLHPDNKNVGIELIGHPEDENGFALAVQLIAQRVFNAG